MRKTLFIISLVSLLAVTACGGGNDDDILKPIEGTTGGGADTPRNSTVKGKIAFEGTPPTMKKIPTTADPKCQNPGLLDESVIVSDGGLENVIIYVSGGDLAGKTFKTPTDPITLNQMGCHYIPHALTIQTGQPLKIVNSDDTSHNIHAHAEVNPQFNESQSQKGLETLKKFDKPEVLLPVRCDVHNWMSAFIGVFEHPMHAISKTGGAYEFKLPAGKYEVTAIHEKYGKKTQMIEVADNASVDLNFSFKEGDKP